MKLVTLGMLKDLQEGEFVKDPKVNLMQHQMTVTN